MLMVGINGIFLAEMLDRWYLPLISVFAFVAANVFPSVAKGGYPSFKFRMIAHGSELLLQFFNNNSAFKCDLYSVGFSNVT